MGRIVAVFNMKGGVGKSTIAVNLAACAALGAARGALLWDLDAQGAASYLLGDDSPAGNARRIFERDLDPEAAIQPTQWSRLDLLAADISLRDLDHALTKADKPKLLRKLLKSLRERYDTIVLDVPPGLGEISEQVFRAADLIVVPLVPTPLSERALAMVREHIERYQGRRPNLLPVISMVDRRKTLHRDFVADHPEWPVIPLASLVERSTVSRKPVVVSAPRSAAAAAFADLWAAAEYRLDDRVLPSLPGQSARKRPKDAAEH